MWIQMKLQERNSLMVQWLGLGAITDTAHGPGSIPGRGTKIPQALLVQQIGRAHV